MAVYNKGFGLAVQDALGGRSYRQVAQKAGVSATYVGDMVMGRVPKRETVLALASACGLSLDKTNELLIAADFAPLSDKDPGWDARASLEWNLRSFRSFFADFPLPEGIIPNDAAGLTQKQIDGILNQLEQAIIDRWGPLRISFDSDRPDADELKASGFAGHTPRPQYLAAVELENLARKYRREIHVDEQRIRELTSEREAREYVLEVERTLGQQPAPPDQDDAAVRDAWEELRATMAELGLPEAAPTYLGGAESRTPAEIAADMREVARLLRARASDTN